MMSLYLEWVREHKGLVNYVDVGWDSQKVNAQHQLHTNH